MATYFFLNVDEICKRRQRKLLLYSTTNSKVQTPTYVEVLPSFTHGQWMNTKYSPARIRYSKKVLYTVFRTTHGRRTDVLWFVGCQNSMNFKLASLGMRGVQERALLVSDTNIGTTVVVPEFR